jgi:hypothetical protein
MTIPMIRVNHDLARRKRHHRAGRDCVVAPDIAMRGRPAEEQSWALTIQAT